MCYYLNVHFQGQRINSMGDGGAFTPRKKLPQPDADHSPPSTADVKNEWNYISTPPSCLHIGHRDNFTLCMYHKKYQLAQKNPLEKFSEEISLCPLYNPSTPSLTHGSSRKVDSFSRNPFLLPIMKVQFCCHTSAPYISK